MPQASLSAFPHLILIGASVRAAAGSALRAGLRPWCLDFFADADLQQLCPALRLHGKESLAATRTSLALAPPGPWMYTGAMENRPALVEALSQVRPLWGNPANVLHRVRCPLQLAQVLRQSSIPCPAVRDEPPTDGKHWLVKPRASAAGHGIHRHSGSGNHARDRWYYQEFIDGAPCAALYSTASDGGTRLLGATRQLVGQTWLHAVPFQYCGSTGPLILDTETEQVLLRLGDVLGQEFGLRGLFGVDFILKDSIPWPVEVNPRYTASIEVLERVLPIAALVPHCQAFAPAGQVSSSAPGAADLARSFQAKAILYAVADLTFPSRGPWQSTLDRLPALEPPPDFADIPHPGQRIARGKPILTFFAGGESEAECLQRLQQIARDLDLCLYGR